MSNGEQAAALRLLMAARELLSDTMASDIERKRLAEQIRRFVEHEPVDAETDPSCGRCAQALSAHAVNFVVGTGRACPKGGGVFVHAERRVGGRRGQLVEEADDE